MLSARHNRLSDSLPSSRVRRREAHLRSSSGIGAAFTMIEVMAVVGIMAILAAILVPTTTAVRSAALKFKTKAQFQQWALALEEFRFEYGYFPEVALENRIDSPRFLAALTARDHSGAEVSGDALHGNKRKIPFYTLSSSDLLRRFDGTATAELLDAFENSQIALLVDRDGDGTIRGSELVRVPLSTGNTRDGFSLPVTPQDPDLADGGVIHARVAIYSAGRGEGPENFVFSWK